MQSSLLVDLASLIARHAAAIVCRGNLISPAAVSRYWSASRSRFNDWHTALASPGQVVGLGSLSTATSPQQRWWVETVPVLDDVLISEILARVMAAVADAIHQLHDTDEVAPIFQSVYRSQIEVSNRVQRVILAAPAAQNVTAVRLNQLRHDAENCIDAFVGSMGLSHTITRRYAICPDRATAIAQQRRGYSSPALDQLAGTLINAAMHERLWRQRSGGTAFASSNQELAESILQMISPAMFDSLGMIKSMRLQRLATDAERSDRSPGQPIPVVLQHMPTADQANDARRFERWFL